MSASAILAVDERERTRQRLAELHDAFRRAYGHAYRGGPSSFEMDLRYLISLEVDLATAPLLQVLTDGYRLTVDLPNIVMREDKKR